MLVGSRDVDVVPNGLVGWVGAEEEDDNGWLGVMVEGIAVDVVVDKVGWEGFGLDVCADESTRGCSDEVASVGIGGLSAFMGVGNLGAGEGEGVEFSGFELDIFDFGRVASSIGVFNSDSGPMWAGSC